MALLKQKIAHLEDLLCSPIEINECDTGVVCTLMPIVPF